MFKIILSGCSVLFFLFLSVLHFIKIDSKQKYKNKIVARIITILLFLVTTTNFLYFCYNVFFLNWSVYSIIEIVILITLIVLIVYILVKKFGSQDQFEICEIIFIICLLLCGLTFFLTAGAKQDLHYKNIKLSKDPIVTKTEYNLISATHSTQISGNINENLNVDSKNNIFVQHSIIENNNNGQLNQKDVYKFYYYDNQKSGEFRLMTIDANKTSLYFTKEDEKPYFVVKKYIKYSLDYNENPPKKIDFEKPTYSYELHIPKDSIVETFKFDTN